MGAFLGAGVGCVAVGAYLLCGGEAGPAMPDWALVVFLPGVLVGCGVQQHFGWEGGLRLVSGVVGVGIGYGLGGFVAAAMWVILARRRKQVKRRQR